MVATDVDDAGTERTVSRVAKDGCVCESDVEYV
jgi:hypothetical protein